MTLSKKARNAHVIEAHAEIFSCPICGSVMDMLEKNRFVCAENHSFDLSKNGYINLAPQAHMTKYDKSLFEARQTVMRSGYFEPVLQAIVAKMKAVESPLVLDAGCGEGSHLSEILAGMPGTPVGVGIDLAKEGVTAAAKSYPGFIWSVADLANCPFQNEQFDTILNILSPANYAEFTRLLKPDGQFFKVVPETGYLKELRDVFYGDESHKEETDPVSRVAEHFDQVQTERITYVFPLEEGLLAPLIRMTPLSWGASADKIEEVLQSDIPAITVDFTLISGMKRRMTLCSEG